MSPPILPPADPEPSGTPPEKRPPPVIPPVAIPKDTGPDPASPRWWERFRTSPPGAAVEGGSPDGPGRSEPPPVPQPVRLAARPVTEAAVGAPVPVAKPSPVAAPRSSVRTWVVRLIMILICVGSAGLLYWSWFKRLQPVNQLHQETFAMMSHLSDEVEQLRLKWTPAEIEQTRARFRAAQRLLFAGPADLQEWEKETARQSLSMMLETALEVGRPEPHPLAGLNLESVRADLYIRPAVPVGVTNAPYKQVLGLIQSVANSPKRVDLLELSVDGDSNSVAQARARLQFLADAAGTNARASAPAGGANP